MHFPVDSVLREEARRYRFVFTCRGCAHFQPDDPVRCSLDFPLEPHLEDRLDTAESVTFCKAFELW